MKTIGITTDCVCDLPEAYLEANGIDLLNFYITTDSGRFLDGYEITSQNLLEYLQEGGSAARTEAPKPAVYRRFFEERLARCDEIVHVAMSCHVGFSYENAMAAVSMMGDMGRRVTVIDSQQISTGMGQMVMRAVRLRGEGRSAQEIQAALLAMRPKIHATFITRSGQHLFRNGRLGKNVVELSEALSLHPVLTMKDGRLVLKSLYFGNYERAIRRFIRRTLGNGRGIDTHRLFITHAGCTLRMIADARAQASRKVSFDEVTVTQASATVSGNCGPGTVGLVFVNK